MKEKLRVWKRPNFAFLGSHSQKEINSHQRKNRNRFLSIRGLNDAIKSKEEKKPLRNAPLTPNRPEIRVEIKSLRKRAQGYTNHELRRKWKVRVYW